MAGARSDDESSSSSSDEEEKRKLAAMQSCVIDSSAVIKRAQEAAIVKTNARRSRGHKVEAENGAEKELSESEDDGLPQLKPYQIKAQDALHAFLDRTFATRFEETSLSDNEDDSEGAPSSNDKGSRLEVTLDDGPAVQVFSRAPGAMEKTKKKRRKEKEVEESQAAGNAQLTSADEAFQLVANVDQAVALNGGGAAENEQESKEKRKKKKGKQVEVEHTLLENGEREPERANVEGREEASVGKKQREKKKRQVFMQGTEGEAGQTSVDSDGELQEQRRHKKEKRRAERSKGVAVDVVDKVAGLEGVASLHGSRHKSPKKKRRELD